MSRLKGGFSSCSKYQWSSCHVFGLKMSALFCNSRQSATLLNTYLNILEKKWMDGLLIHSLVPLLLQADTAAAATQWEPWRHARCIALGQVCSGFTDQDHPRSSSVSLPQQDVLGFTAEILCFCFIPHQPKRVYLALDFKKQQQQLVTVANLLLQATLFLSLKMCISINNLDSHLSARRGPVLVLPPVKTLQRVLAGHRVCVGRLAWQSHTDHKNLLSMWGLAHNEGIILQVCHHWHQFSTAAAAAPPLLLPQ